MLSIGIHAMEELKLGGSAALKIWLIIVCCPSDTTNDYGIRCSAALKIWLIVVCCLSDTTNDYRIRCSAVLKIWLGCYLVEIEEQHC